MTNSETIALLLLYGNVTKRDDKWISFIVPGTINCYSSYVSNTYDVVKGWIKTAVLDIESENSDG